MIIEINEKDKVFISCVNEICAMFHNAEKTSIAETCTFVIVDLNGIKVDEDSLLNCIKKIRLLIIKSIEKFNLILS